MDVWISTRSLDGTEWGLTTARNLARNPSLQTDVDGGPMILSGAFEAGSYEEAKAVHEGIMDGWRSDGAGGSG